MRKIALVNQKGGCGKTTTAINLACCLSDEGKKVLLIDLDPQGHLALGLGVKPEQLEKSIYEVLIGQIPISEAIQSLRQNLNAVFSDVVLSAFEQVMAGTREREYKLVESLEDIEDNYDYLIVDSPPSVSLLTFNVLMASEEVIIPVDSSFFSLHGLEKLLDTMRIIEEKARHELSINILITNVDLRTRFSRYVVQTLKENFPENCFKTIIRTCTRLREAASHGQPIVEYDPRCAAFCDYESLTKEILGQEAEMEVRNSSLEPFQARAVGELAEREIVFTLQAPFNIKVHVAGDFNNWEPEALHLTNGLGGPIWQKRVRLKPGSYQYKFLLDGDWVPDPANEKAIYDPYGGANSVIHV